MSATLTINTYNEEDHPVLMRRIRDTCSLFERDGGRILCEDVGPILRSFHVWPTENELYTVILPYLTAKEPDAPTVQLDDLLPFILSLVLDRAYEPDNEDTLLAAFRALDSEGKKYINESSLREWLSETEWAFRDKEIDEFLRTAKDSETGFIHYEGSYLLI